MFCARFLCGLMCLGLISCSESDGHGNGTQENAVTADGAVIDLSDDSTDPAVSLLDGAVCDLLGGLLCPVGLLCVEGSCQEPSD